MMILKTKTVSIFLLLSFLTLSALASAEADEAVKLLTTPTSSDYALTMVGGGLWVGSEIFKDSIAPSEPRWKTPNALERAVRDSLKWRNTDLNIASRSSDLLLVGAVSSLFWTPLLTENDYRSHVMVGLEAVILSGVLMQGVKFAVGRQRPYSYYSTRPAKGADDYLSFYSGHASTVFAVATSTAYLLSDAHPKQKNVIWSSALAVAATVAYLRVAADKHYFSDVLVGGLTGGTIGYLVARARRTDSNIGGQPLTFTIKFNTF
jgi:membrane-associated phospholipid phosphatase